MLKARIYEKLREEQLKKQGDMRRSMVGTGDLSERIRTYTFPHGRVTDHRVNVTLHKLDRVLAGESLDEIIDVLITEDQAARLAALE